MASESCSWWSVCVYIYVFDQRFQKSVQNHL